MGRGRQPNGDNPSDLQASPRDTGAELMRSSQGHPWQMGLREGTAVVVPGGVTGWQQGAFQLVSKQTNKQQKKENIAEVLAGRVSGPQLCFRSGGVQSSPQEPRERTASPGLSQARRLPITIPKWCEGRQAASCHPKSPECCLLTEPGLLSPLRPTCGRRGP